MKTKDADVFFSCVLLGFHQSGRSVNTDNQTAGNLQLIEMDSLMMNGKQLQLKYLRIERATVASLVHSKNSFYPGHNFMAGRICGFVEVEPASPTINQLIAVPHCWE